MFSVAMMCHFNASALFGIKIHYERGAKEWNAAHTEAVCIGRGICEFKITGNAMNVGTLGNGENNRFGFATSKDVLRNTFWAETFNGGYLFIDKDIELSTDIISKIRNCPRIIKAGKYPYTIEGTELVVYFN